MLQPDLLETKHVNVRVDTESELCRGRTVADVWGRTGLEPNAHVAVEVRAAEFMELLLERLESLG